MIDDNLPVMLGVFGAAVAVQYALLRKRVTSIADPLAYFIVTSSFSMALGYFATDTSWLMARIFAYFACFYVGFVLASGGLRPTPSPLHMEPDLRQFRAIVIACCAVYLGFNVFIWVQSGVIVFSDEPTLQKSEAYAAGFGFVRRLNWSVGTFALIASLYWWLRARSAAATLAVIVTVLTSLTGGGKGALLPAIFAVGLFIAKPFSRLNGRNDAARLRRLIPALLAIATVPVAMVLLSEHETPQGAFDAFVVRLFYFGDVLLYWGQESVRQHFSGVGPLDYVRNTFGSVFGVLRLIDYDIPMGNQFVQYTLPVGVEFSESLGPNLPFYVRGELYFGPFLAPLHALVIGWIFGRMRRLFVNYGGHSLLTYSLLSFAVVVSIALPTEEGLAVGQVFDFIIFFSPIYLAATWTSGLAGRRKRSPGADSRRAPG